MHYPSDAFAKDPTIPVIQPLHGKPVLGQRKTLSAVGSSYSMTSHNLDVDGKNLYLTICLGRVFHKFLVYQQLDVKKLNRFYCKASGLYGFTGGKPIRRWGFRRPV